MCEPNNMKKCGLLECYHYNLLLTKCELCNKEYCDAHFRNHGCIEQDNIILECDICNKVISEDMLDYDYRSTNIKNIGIINKRIREINSTIEKEIKRRLEKQLKDRQSSNVSYLFNKNVTNVDIADDVERKFKQQLTTLKKLKQKFILKEHQALGCYTKKKKVVKCGICKKKDFLIKCNKCDKQFCIHHRLPEVHNCKCQHKT